MLATSVSLVLNTGRDTQQVFNERLLSKLLCCGCLSAQHSALLDLGTEIVILEGSVLPPSPSRGFP